jgi:hypothetical protein
MRPFVHRVAVTARTLLCCGLIAAAGSGCSGSAGSPLTAGPIVVETTLQSNLTQPAAPLAVGQSVTAGFFETRCRYQQYTSEKAHGQYKQLGCDSPFNPAHVVVTVAPIASSGQPCGLSAQVHGSSVVFTKTGQGDPGLGGAPVYFCSAQIADPTVHDPPNGRTSFML